MRIRHFITGCFSLLFVLTIKGQEPNFEMTGYATVEGEGFVSTTGGKGGDTITVLSLDELRTYAASREKNNSPAILVISGRLEATPSEVVTFKHGSNLSILGGENGTELIGVGIRIWDYHNVIIRNLKIHEIFYPDDALSIEECHHVWIDHNELYSKTGAGIGIDTYDGLLDIKKGSRFVTVSWNYLHHHMKCMLIGHTDNATQGEIDRDMRITIHHNIFEYTNGRNPSLRWGAAHIFNNFFGNIDDYAIALRQGAHGLIENNVFHNVNTCISTNKFDGEGFACLSGNVYTGSSLESENSITQTGCDFWNDLPYSYEADVTDNLETLLRINSGILWKDTTSTEPDTTFVNGLNDVQLKPGNLSCFPNPVYDIFQLTFQSDLDEIYEMVIRDLTGREVVRKQVHMKKGANKINMERGNLKQGIYLLSVAGPKTQSSLIRMAVF